MLPKAKDYFDELEFTESGNWNAARTYSEAMIARFLIECQGYERLAQFGMEHPDEQYMMPPEMIKQRRLDAMRWYIDTLKTIIDNTFFALKLKGKTEAGKYYSFLETIEDLYEERVLIKSEDRGKHTIDIDEDRFKLILKNIKLIRRQLNMYLNQADLIFQHREEFDPVKLKQKMMDDMINRG